MKFWSCCSLFLLKSPDFHPVGKGEADFMPISVKLKFHALRQVNSAKQARSISECRPLVPNSVARMPSVCRKIPRTEEIEVLGLGVWRAGPGLNREDAQFDGILEKEIYGAPDTQS
ncbi:hypothetical protein [Neorhizobium galegae]|uniref:hypothetical protein n=1 Tax=Neorhizobium galegae TaxID=399 RepID=UPI0012FF38C4|nr:hypothetical protein [Neorhizobium galegae]